MKKYTIIFHIDYKEKIKDILKAKKITSLKLSDTMLDDLKDETAVKEILSLDPTKEYVKIIRIKNLLEKKEIDQFKEGDKVLIEYLETDFLPVKNEKGTIYRKENDKIIVRAYKHKNKGWQIYIGDNAIIRKGWEKKVEI